MASMLGRARSQHQHQHLHLHQRHSHQLVTPAEARAVPAVVLPDAPSPVEIARRAAITCPKGGTDCATTSGSSTTLPIAIGVAVPVTFALVLFIFLHRRHLKKLRAEDMNENHRSLDFGFEPSAQAKKRKRGGKKKGGNQSISDFEKQIRHPKGLSMDMDLTNPYMLPPQMQESRESLHSLSRSLVNQGHDPYRPVASIAGSIRGSVRGDDGASIHTGGTGSTMNRNLIRNASAMHQSNPPRQPPPNGFEGPFPGTRGSTAGSQKTMPISPPATTSPPMNANIVKTPSPPPVLPTPVINEPVALSTPKVSSSTDSTAPSHKPTASRDVNVVRPSSQYLATLAHSREASVEGQSQHASIVEASPDASPPRAELGPPSPPRRLSLKLEKSLPQISLEQEFPGSTNLQYTEIVVPPARDAACRTPGGTNRNPPAQTHSEAPQQPQIHVEHEEDYYYEDDYYDDGQGQYQDYSQQYDEQNGYNNQGYANDRLSIMRPLPPQEPYEDPETRANRIRSFYKEYFNEREVQAHAPQAADYYEDYGSEYHGNPTIFDPQSQQFVVAQAPFAAPVTRRAMTPPPRGPPRFRAGPMPPRPGGPGGPGGPSEPSIRSGRSRANSTWSTGTGIRGGPRGRPQMRNQPPPKPLNNLPTPHLLKDDSVAIFGAAEFAPPPRFREQASGRPQSPFLDARPYSPSVRAHTPLASAHNDLAPMPSPHLLRKSGTFTALDFAPPPRIRDRGDGAGSDAGSIRSGRSGRSVASARTQQHVRAGTYRLSRIPTALVGTQREFAETLRPSWHVGSK